MTRRAAIARRREHTGDRQTDELWRALSAVADVLNASPFTGGRLITEEPGALAGSGLSFAAGTARSIPHGLGRKARGFVEVYGAEVPSAGHVGLRSTAHPSGTTSDAFVTVTPAATGTCWLWVF